MSHGLDVLNHMGRDPRQDFRDGPGAPDSAIHAPVNFHAYAACTGGRFLASAGETDSSSRCILLLVANDISKAMSGMVQLKKKGLRVYLSFKETGIHQIQDLMAKPRNLEIFLKLAKQADGFIAPAKPAAAFFENLAAQGQIAKFIPTPYPVEFPQWDFSIPVEKRSGIFIGTREFHVPTRRHIEALALGNRLSRELDCPVTVFNSDGRRGIRLLGSMGLDFSRWKIIDRRLPYPEFLHVMASHRIALQLDASFVPGQVAGDALLCRLPCIGGNSAIEEEAFPMFQTARNSGPSLHSQCRELMRDDKYYTDTIAQSHALATEHLSFTAVAEKLRNL